VEAVIVGAGTFGDSAAWRLARSGERVTLVDQFEPGDPRASSGGETRLYRCAHGSDTEYTAMARRARALWRQLEDAGSNPAPATRKAPQSGAFRFSGPHMSAAVLLPNSCSFHCLGWPGGLEGTGDP
jgi:glycine/D-amino acid oxidase-like deaminating enzyme